jgi:hypothetical protein
MAGSRALSDREPGQIRCEFPGGRKVLANSIFELGRTMEVVTKSMDEEAGSS